MSLAIRTSVCAMVYLIVCALGDGVDGQNPSKKPQDVTETGSTWAEGKLFSSVITDSSTRAGRQRLRWVPPREFHGDEQRPGLAKVILHMPGGLTSHMVLHTYIHTYIHIHT